MHKLKLLNNEQLGTVLSGGTIEYEDVDDDTFLRVMAVSAERYLSSQFNFDSLSCPLPQGDHINDHLEAIQESIKERYELFFYSYFVRQQGDDARANRLNKAMIDMAYDLCVLFNLSQLDLLKQEPEKLDTLTFNCLRLMYGTEYRNPDYEEHVYSKVLYASVAVLALSESVYCIGLRTLQLIESSTTNSNRSSILTFREIRPDLIAFLNRSAVLDNVGSNYAFFWVLNFEDAMTFDYFGHNRSRIEFKPVDKAAVDQFAREGKFEEVFSYKQGSPHVGCPVQQASIKTENGSRVSVFNIFVNHALDVFERTLQSVDNDPAHANTPLPAY